MCTVAEELNLLDLAPLLHGVFCDKKLKIYHYTYIAPLLQMLLAASRRHKMKMHFNLSIGLRNFFLNGYKET